jgi:sugar lactone lactonase YvrE
MRSALSVAAIVALGAAFSASAATPIRVTLATAPPSTLAVGQPWAAQLRVRPASTRLAVRVLAVRGVERLTVRATGRRGVYRVRLVFPRPGRWTLTARVGRWTSRLGAVSVRAVPQPVDLLGPTTMELEQDGTLLVVENGSGRLLRVDPSTGRSEVLAASLGTPYAVARAPSGDLYLSVDNLLRRIDGAGALTTVAQAASDIGPVAVARNGDVYYTTVSDIFRLAGGAGAPIHVVGTGASGAGGDGGPATSASVSAPHGLAFAADGALLIADTGNDRIRRVDPVTGVMTSLAELGIPVGLDIASDGALYTVETRTNRVLRLDSSSARAGVGDGRLTSPIDVEVAPDGTVFVLEGGLSPGRLKRVAPNGTVTTVTRPS